MTAVRRLGRQSPGRCSVLSLDAAAAAIVLVALCGYTIFGRADFGGGVWTCLATGPRANLQRRALFRAMGPVWETNHIWLILAVVALFTAFPSAFAALFTALFVPLTVALVGITFRGAAFAFHHYGEDSPVQLPATELVFAVTSLLTPFALGICVGAVAAGRVVVAPDGSVSSTGATWLAPFPLLCGLIAVVMCALLTAAYMTVRTTAGLRTAFRNRAIAAALALGVFTTAALPVGRMTDAYVATQLLGTAALGFTSLAVLLGVLTLLVLWRRRYRWAPPAAAATCCAVLLAWGAAQYPFLIPPTMRIADAAAPHNTLVALLVAMLAGLLLLGPALFLLLRVLAQGRVDVEETEHAADIQP
jgi:cytochrome d ubiquinol oxidase subunit II